MPVAWRIASHPDSINPTIHGLIAQHAAVKPDAVDLAKKDPCMKCYIIALFGSGACRKNGDDSGMLDWMSNGVETRIRRGLPP
jgi:hypothetical protein